MKYPSKNFEAAYEKLGRVESAMSHAVGRCIEAIGFLNDCLDEPTLAKLYDNIAEWSDKTFGDPSQRGPLGPLKHLAKEAAEAQEKPGDLSEYADCLILVLDAARRAGFTDEELLQAGFDKMEVNRSRDWPTPQGDEPAEHDRSKD